MHNRVPMIEESNPGQEEYIQHQLLQLFYVSPCGLTLESILSSVTASQRAEVQKTVIRMLQARLISFNSETSLFHLDYKGESRLAGQTVMHPVLAPPNFYIHVHHTPIATVWSSSPADHKAVSSSPQKQSPEAKTAAKKYTPLFLLNSNRKKQSRQPVRDEILAILEEHPDGLTRKEICDKATFSRELVASQFNQLKNNQLIVEDRDSAGQSQRVYLKQYYDAKKRTPVQNVAVNQVHDSELKAENELPLRTRFEFYAELKPTARILPLPPNFSSPPDYLSSHTIKRSMR